MIVASTGRPDSLAKMARSIAAQTRPPDRLVFSVVDERDLPADRDQLAGAEVVFGPRGLPRQRNAGLGGVGTGVDLIVFFDDDFVPSRFALARVAEFFAGLPDVVGATGHVLADGINLPGIPDADADAIVAAYDRDPPDDAPSVKRDVYGLYGCNMVFRAAAIGDVRFDERLPLYGWQEDIDFAAQLLPRGRLVQTRAFAGVHQGLKGGRASGVRLGYSQVINPLYLARKGTMRRKYARALVRRNVVANLLRAVRPEPWVDRRGRLWGNLIGLIDLARGRITPERIEQL